MIEINLVPDVKQELLKAQRVRSTVITFAIMVGLIAVGIVIALAFYVFAVQNVRGALLDSSIKDKSQKLSDVSDLSKSLTIQNQLTKISSLNDAKKVDSRIFDVLNAIIPPAPNDVQLSDVTIDSENKVITMNGQAQNSYAAVEVFKKTIGGTKIKYKDVDGKTQEKDLASNISTSDTSYGEDSSGRKVLRFTLTFNYDEELFSPLSKNLSVVVTTNGNVTDSYLGVPRSIFTDRAKDIKGGQ